MMTSFLQCFWISTQVGFASFRNLPSSFGEVYDPFCTVFFGSIFYIFSKILKIWNHIFRFSDSWPKKIGFGARGRFCVFFMSTKSSICSPHWYVSINSLRCSTKVFPMNLPVNMALALFLNNCKIIEIFVKGVSGKSGFF